ncbi:hypothetical protein A3K73_05490 [Candidatus Pacearchaeota archaeon RBG_13_36_9]|nr:MAG: hypothetical protein A3K73_05490 [Candidatus Pacearchaeota archaeon RBG_13_36_9]
MILFVWSSFEFPFTGFFIFKPSASESASLPSDVMPSEAMVDAPGKTIANKTGGMIINVIKGENQTFKGSGGGGGVGGGVGGGGGGGGGGKDGDNGGGEGGEEKAEEKNKSAGIVLISPGENALRFEEEIVFSYEIAENAGSCSLVLDSEIAWEHKNVSSGINNFTLFNLSRGKHFWSISCDSLASSQKRRVMVIKANRNLELDGNWEDIEKAGNLSLGKKGAGRIKFLGIVNLSNCENMEDYIVVGKNFIGIDSDKIPELNQPAEVTFYGLEFKHPIILRDGKPCKDCQLLNNGQELVFRVDHFSNYSATENSALFVWDKTISGSVVFYANYTKVADSTPIENANCSVDFGAGFRQMNYSSGLYSYDSVSSGSGTATINCSAAGYTEIVLTDYFSSNPGTRVNGAGVTPGDSQTAPADEPESHSALAGNVTYMTVFGYSTTQSWQGYYGNVSGTIQLADSNDKVLYNWSALAPNGEVYATRAFDPNFAAISCVDDGAIASEEALMGQIAGDADSISNTFNAKSHPSFFVGSIEIPINNCSSANLYGPGGEQSSSFYEVLLKDDSNIIYTSVLEKNLEGFDGNDYDFEMMVAENGHGADTSATTYYFYIEFG